MNQQRYLEIRDLVDLRHDPKALKYYWLQTAILIAACCLLLIEFAGSPVRFLAVPLMSLIMFRNFGLMHEAVHGLLSKDNRINHTLGIVSGAFCLLSFDSWKQSHLEHHRWSGNIDKDPVAAMIKTYPTFPKALQSALTFGWKCWLPTLSFLQHTVFWAITFRYAFQKKRDFGQILSAAIPALFWIGLLALLSAKTTVSILLPGVLLYLIGTEVINAPHHLGLTYFRGETKIPVWEQFKTARTCVYPTWLARFVVLNFNYHTEHHMYPYVPWYHLDKLHRRLRDELKQEHNLDPSFSWILRNRTKDLYQVFGSDQVIASRKNNAA